MADEAPEVKPGWKTTEFWLSSITALIGILYASGAIAAGGQTDHWVGLVVAGLASMGYTASRGKVKS